jgi:hypothetical protein
VVQTRTGDDGNCLNACIASILELPLKAVPEFGEDWQEDLNDFLSTKGLRYRRVPMYKKPSGYSTIEGISPRGGLHACVALDGELAWDPHPIEDGTGQGLVEPRYYGLLEPVKVRVGDTLYHGTTQEAATRIMSEGLKMPKGSIRVTSDKAYAERAALLRAEETGSKHPVVLTLKSDAEKFFDADASGLHESSKRTLPSKFISSVTPVKHRVTDRADMARLRKNTEKQGGPFFMQETTKSGKERTIPVRELAKGADSKASEAFFLLLAIYAWYKSREKPPPPTYDLAKYVPKKRALDAPIDRYRMSDILDALGIDIKEYMRRTEPQKKALLKTALEKLSSK